MGQKTVTVTLSSGALEIQQDWRDLAAGDWVQWEFLGLGDGQFGFISFAPPSPRLGPFYSLRSSGHNLFLGKGNKGKAVENDYHYRALVLHPDHTDAVASAAGTIHNAALDLNTSPEITVTYHKEVDAQGKIIKQWLDVCPDPVGLNTGDTATWHFECLPENAFACFRFDPTATDGIQVPNMTEASGPFLAFNACNGDGTVTVEASAMGFIAALSEAERLKHRQFTYNIQLRQWDGTLIALHDPIIDNLGPPVPNS